MNLSVRSESRKPRITVSDPRNPRFQFTKEFQQNQSETIGREKSLSFGWRIGTLTSECISISRPFGFYLLACTTACTEGRKRSLCRLRGAEALAPSARTSETEAAARLPRRHPLVHSTRNAFSLFSREAG